MVGAKHLGDKLLGKPKVLCPNASPSDGLQTYHNPIFGLFGGNKHGQDIGITVEIEAGVPISDIRSPSHQINATQEGRIVRVKLDNEIVPKDVVFLIDTSGSQKGAPMEQSKELMWGFVNGLNPQDTFTVINFSNTNTQLSPTPIIFLLALGYTRRQSDYLPQGMSNLSPHQFTLS